MTTKRATSFRLSPEAEQILDLEAATLGVPRTAVVEQALRELFDRNQVRRVALAGELAAIERATGDPFWDLPLARLPDGSDLDELTVALADALQGG